LYFHEDAPHYGWYVTLFFFLKRGAIVVGHGGSIAVYGTCATSLAVRIYHLAGVRIG
jgi:hypothetical protein